MDNIKFNFKGVFIQSLQSKFSVLLPCIISFALTCTLYVLFCAVLKGLSLKIAFEIVSALPNILGFTLGGYALIIGLGNEKLLQIICEVPPGKRTSLYQQLNAAFALTLIIQIITFLFGLSYKLIFSDDKFSILLKIGIVHDIVTFVLCYFSLWSLFSLIDLAIKIFNIGQLQFLHLRKGGQN